MRFLLTAVNAKFIHSNPALYSLRAYAAEYGEHIETAEYTINHKMDFILADIYRKKPDAAAFSCYIWNWELIGNLIPELHKILPDLPIWLGGPEVSFDSGDILKKYPMVTGIMLGEGEVTFKELLSFYLYGKPDLHSIRGLALPDGTTGPRELTDVSRLPFLYDSLQGFENRIIYYESGRGCPYQCSYCLSSIDKTVRLRDPAAVEKELQYFLDQKVKQVKFVDRTFNCSHEHALAVWNYLQAHDNGITNFHFEIAADLLTEEELRVLGSLRPGLVQLEIGVQSANPETLREIRRRTDMARLKENVARIRKGKNIHIHLDLIAGLPFEDYESFIRSFNTVFAMGPDQLQLGFLKVLKGSPMHEKAGEYGIFYTDKPPYEVLYSKWLPYEKILLLKQVEEMVEIYYNSGQFSHTIPVLQQAFAHPFELFQKLAAFYEEEGYALNSPSRARRYHILLAFAVRFDKEREELYKELLIYDMYLRENLKSRPDFAKDLKPYKEEIKRFYRKEEKEPSLLKNYKGYSSIQASRMTHLEPFRFQVWDPEEQKETEEAAYVLFDYERRDPLTREAYTAVWRKGGRHDEAYERNIGTAQ